MADEKKVEGLSISDFSEIVGQGSRPDGKFAWALVLYNGERCMIQNENWYNAFKNASVIPESITILKEPIRTYKKDSMGNREMGPDGKPIVIETAVEGWRVVAAKTLLQLKNESEVKIETKLLKVNEDTAVLNAKSKYFEAVQRASSVTEISAETQAKIDFMLAGD